MSQALVGKTKWYTNCIRNPTSIYATKNWNNHYFVQQPTVTCSLNKPVHRLATNG